MRTSGRHVAASALALAGAACVGACFAVADLDRFQRDVADAAMPDDPTAPSDLRLKLLGMKPHLDQRIEYRIIDANNFVQSRGVIEPVDEPSAVEVEITVPKGIPVASGPYRLDFYADVDGSGQFEPYTDPPAKDKDHAWRIEPLVDYPAGSFPHVANVVQVQFTHNKLFTDISKWPGDTPNPPVDAGNAGVRLRFFGVSMSQFQNKLLEVRVSEAASGHVVAVYRKPAIPATDFVGFVPGVVELLDSYNVDVYIDANGNGTYESPTGPGESVDRVWRFPMIAAATSGGGGAGGAGAGGAGGGGGGGEPVIGIDLEFDPSKPSSPIDIGAP